MSRATGRNWYAVLIVDTLIWQTNRGDGVTHKDIKRQYHRLCLALHGCTPTRTARKEAAGQVTAESSEKGRESRRYLVGRPLVSNLRACSRGEPISIAGFFT
jgi:hypothetical protein